MLIWDFLVALIVAAALAVALSLVSGRTAGWAGFFFALLILLFATWAGGIWVAPFGTRPFAISVVVFLVVGVITALILSAVLPPARRSDTPPTAGSPEAPDVGTLGVEFGLFFWLLLLVLILSIAARYFWR